MKHYLGQIICFGFGEVGVFIVIENNKQIRIIRINGSFVTNIAEVGDYMYTNKRRLTFDTKFKGKDVFGTREMYVIYIKINCQFM